MKDRITPHRLMMKIETTTATKIFVAIFVQEHLELIVDCFNNWAFVDGDNPNGPIQTNSSIDNHLNSNEGNKTNNETNYRWNNQNDSQENFYWNGVASTECLNELNTAYEKIVHWRRNLFMLPNGAAGRNYIKQLSHLIKLWINDTPLRKIALKAIHWIPVLLL